MQLEIVLFSGKNRPSLSRIGAVGRPTYNCAMIFSWLRRRRRRKILDEPFPAHWEQILQKNVGQVVELRMKSGEKIGGKVEKVGDKLVHLSQLTGAEFFDAAVDSTDIAAVIVRTKR